MPSKEIIGCKDSIGVVLTKADGSIVINDNKPPKLTNDILKKMVEKDGRENMVGFGQIQ
jgi:hypothetical protein